MIKPCLVCGQKFDAMRNVSTCSEKCRDLARIASRRRYRKRVHERTMEQQRAKRVRSGNEYDRRYREKNREQIRERNRLWSAENAAKIGERYLAQRHAARQRMKSRYAARSDEEKKAQKRKKRFAYLLNREAVLEKGRQRRERDKEKLRAWRRQDRIDHPEKYRAREARRDPVKVREYARRTYAKRAAALRLVRELQMKGSEALL